MPWEITRQLDLPHHRFGRRVIDVLFYLSTQKLAKNAYLRNVLLKPLVVMSACSFSVSFLFLLLRAQTTASFFARRQEISKEQKEPAELVSN